MKTNEEVLNIVYHLTEDVVYEINESGIVTILERQDAAVQRFFRKLKFRIPLYKKIELDEYASFVFLQIDGNRTVGEIGHLLEEKYGEKAHPVYERLLLFLNHIEVNAKYIERQIGT